MRRAHRSTDGRTATTKAAILVGQFFFQLTMAQSVKSMCTTARVYVCSYHSTMFWDKRSEKFAHTNTRLLKLMYIFILIIILLFLNPLSSFFFFASNIYVSCHFVAPRTFPNQTDYFCTNNCWILGKRLPPLAVMRTHFIKIKFTICHVAASCRLGCLGLISRAQFLCFSTIASFDDGVNVCDFPHSRARRWFMFRRIIIIFLKMIYIFCSSNVGRSSRIRFVRMKSINLW